MSNEMQPAKTLFAGDWLTVRQQGTWEYVSRNGGINAAAILAIDEAAHIILVEQYRVPLGRNCLELPAGLVGDLDAGDTPLDAARRELEEETGYSCETVEDLGFFHASPGMVTEGFTLVRARGLKKIGDGGGVDGEDIIVHRVPLANLTSFIAEKRQAGVAMDVKLLLLLGGNFLAA